MTLAGIRKALMPFILSLLAMVVSWVTTGDFDRLELGTIVSGAITSVLVYWVPNADN